MCHAVNPIAAAMIAKGLDPGAAFVFLLIGPTTNAAGIATIWKILGQKTAVLYLLAVAGCALAGGLLLNLLASGNPSMVPMHHHGSMLPGFVNYVSIIVLFIVLAFAIIHKPKEIKETS